MKTNEELQIAKKKELQFYKRKFLSKIRDFNKDREIDPYFKDLIGDKKEVSIADLGCGLLSTTGNLLNGVNIYLYPSDYLAEEYDKLFIKYNTARVIPIFRQDMESLTYEDEMFDIVHCVNALDHTRSPQKALQEMFRVCKVGGYIYLRHHENNGELVHYNGVHQWNMEIVGDDLRFWNLEEEFMLSSIIKGFKHEKRRERLSYKEWPRVISICQK